MGASGGRGYGVDVAPATDRAGAEIRHDALIYGSDDDLVAAGVAYLRAGLDASDVVIVHGPLDYVDRFRDALDDDPRVRFTDATGMYHRPMNALIAYQMLFDRDLPEDARVRVIGPVPFGEEADSQARWARYEAVVNRALSGYAFVALCTYDARTLPPAIIDVARATHPHLVTGAGRALSREYAPAAVLRRYPQAEPEPAAVGPLELALDRVQDLGSLREGLHRVAVRAALSAQPARDFVLAANEVITNALRHGVPPVGVRLWAGPRRLLLRVTDAGPGIRDPFIGYESSTVAMRRGLGSGLWLARQLVSELTTATTPDGCAVWLAVDL